ncbi:peptidoglycan D,D-transpeptidase FtsI family protein [Anaerosalibacter massiliensis]|uniref:Penicillin-binding transpeptidase domain-containing protein n=1 Tax=Anaerosalibacter massiliensis TaxID=1347392 RepID=A0A9X2S422_9FIRM|nr:penicillin-binding transpeptidase domain-containing protein [Anaerosalibacter massiliensis]MCR2042824.1 penicillin-binding transpeptidase domain-containing protein [Anaerosalibacter massiliensis]
MGKYSKDIIQNRVLKSAFIIFFIFMLLIFRLYWIQIIKNEEYRLAALKQRGKEVEIYPARGIIYDKNLIPLTNRERVPTLFLIGDYFLKDKEALDFIMDKGIETDLINRDMNQFKEIEIDELLDNDSLPKGIFFTEKIARYNKENILSHVIGHTKKSENKGESGIEKTFDDVLKKENTGSIYFEIDNKKNPILGGGYSLVENKDINKPSNVQLTVDYHIQKIVEEIMDEEGIKGSVIVSDTNNGDIVAMASRPNFIQGEIDNFFNRENMELYNKGIQVSYPPGSLFKVVVLLAALEEDPSLIRENFYCKGFEELNDLVIKCNKEEGHGELSIKEAFAKSCNSAFIQIGERVGSDKVIDAAKKLGFGEKINIGLTEEVKGNLPKGEETKGPSIGNISIGQGSVEVTPLQITNMIMIIANKGVKKDLSIIKGIVTDDGKMVKEFNKEKNEEVVSEESCKVIDEYMAEVILNGTARSMNLEDIGGAAGKTGSAQAILNGKDTIHGWFSGYFPRENPKYVITVFVEDDSSGSASAIPIFEKISREIWNKNR